MNKAAERKREFRLYAIGFVFAAALTTAAFVLIWLRPVSPSVILGLLGLLALIQIAVHFRFFLHIDLDRSHRDDLQLILFTSMVIFLMVGGTVWILWNQHGRMM